MRRVLLLHGVNSSGEWHATTTAECRGVFDCTSLRYRHFHGLWGAVKVYVWPSALLILAATSIGLAATGWPLTYRLLAIGSMLVVQAVIVALAEYDWSKDLPASVAAPLLFGLAGPSGAAAWSLGLWDQSAAPLAFLIASLVGLCGFLDLREYGEDALPWDVAFSVSLLIALASGFGVAWLESRTSGRALTWTIIGLILLMVLEPWIRRDRAFAIVRRRLGEHGNGGHSVYPHIIAHSLGTYITGHTLNEDASLRVGRLLFTGCVLDAKFPWKHVLHPQRRNSCWEVHNHVGRLDVVPLMTRFLRIVWVALTCPARSAKTARPVEFLGLLTRWRPLGGAGQSGFKDQADLVHSVKPLEVCAGCSTGPRAPVHNVPGRFAGHSTMNGDSEYQVLHWLPYLWGDLPAKFDLWKEICRAGCGALAELNRSPAGISTAATLQAWRTLSKAEELILNSPWYFPLTDLDDQGVLRGRMLGQYVDEILESLPGPRVAGADVLKRIPAFLFQKVGSALEERRKPDGSLDVMSCLDPRTALYAAVCQAIQADGSRA